MYKLPIYLIFWRCWWRCAGGWGADLGRAVSGAVRCLCRRIAVQRPDLALRRGDRRLSREAVSAGMGGRRARRARIPGGYTGMSLYTDLRRKRMRWRRCLRARRPWRSTPRRRYGASSRRTWRSTKAPRGPCGNTCGIPGGATGAETICAAAGAARRCEGFERRYSPRRAGTRRRASNPCLWARRYAGGLL